MRRIWLFSEFIFYVERCVMKRLLPTDFQEDETTTEELWASKHQKQLGSVFIRSGKPSKVQSPGLLRCAECGSEVKVLVSPRRNPHSSKLGRAVSMKDHDLCRRCWRRLMQQVPPGTVVDLERARHETLQDQAKRPTRVKPQEFPQTAS